MDLMTFGERLERAKKKIIELEVRRKRESIQNGHCPYSHLYCSGIEHPEVNCDDVDCDECTATFFREYEQRVTKRVNRDFPTESDIDMDVIVGQLKALSEIEERDMEYLDKHSYRDGCIYNLHDLAEGRYKAFCEAIEIITSTVNKQ